jgi:hypothetical protein
MQYSLVRNDHLPCPMFEQLIFPCLVRTLRAHLLPFTRPNACVFQASEARGPYH